MQSCPIRTSDGVGHMYVLQIVAFGIHSYKVHSGYEAGYALIIFQKHSFVHQKSCGKVITHPCPPFDIYRTDKNCRKMIHSILYFPTPFLPICAES